MDLKSTLNGEFLKELREIVRNNLTVPQFGVSMLAREVGMSRSNLHRKVSSLAKISVSQFIRQERLKAGLKLLKRTSLTVSEVTYKVGFNNVSYFIKCFHEYYGFSPGEVGKREQEVANAQTGIKRKIKPVYIIGLITILILVISAFVFSVSNKRRNIPKTVAILPPYYEMLDSSYLSIINGTVQNVIDNLNLIKDVDRITPWLSVLQYKNSTKPAPEIAKELKVYYVVKPSILSYDGNIHLKIRLIEGLKDNQIWTNSFEIDVNDVTTIYRKISKEIAREINAQITPSEQQKIEKPITTNAEALICYNKGNDFINLWREIGNTDYLDKAIIQFEKTLEYDKECASAWGQLSTINFDLYSLNHSEINRNNTVKYAAQANFYDSYLDKSLEAMALSASVMDNYEGAIMYLEKALEYNPNSMWVYIHLLQIYRRWEVSNPEHIKLVLKAVRYISDGKDSLGMTRLYLNIVYTLRTAGLYEEARDLLDLVNNLNTDNPNLHISKSEILIFKEHNIDSAKKILTNLIAEDPESDKAKQYQQYLFKDLFWNREYEKAYSVFNNLYHSDSSDVSINNTGLRNVGLRIMYMQRYLVTLEHLGLEKEYDKYKNTYNENYNNYETTRNSSFGSFYLIRSFCINHEAEKAMQELRNFGKQNYFMSQNIYILEFSPLFDIIRENKDYQKEYQEILAEIKRKFESNREQIREMIKENRLLDEHVNS